MQDVLKNTVTGAMWLISFFIALAMIGVDVFRCVRCAKREYYEPEFKNFTLGFRCAKDI